MPCVLDDVWLGGLGFILWYCDTWTFLTRVWYSVYLLLFCDRKLSCASDHGYRYICVRYYIIIWYYINVTYMSRVWLIVCSSITLYIPSWPYAVCQVYLRAFCSLTACSSITFYLPRGPRGMSGLSYGLLFTCRVVNRRVGFWCGLTGCRSGSILSLVVQEVLRRRCVITFAFYKGKPG
jgi:hypothetical protein